MNVTSVAECGSLRGVAVAEEMTSFKRVALVPARAGSKRIPKKNIKMFHGRPMFSWIFSTLEATGIFDEIILSTEDPEIAELGLGVGYRVPFLRPSELADDFATTSEVADHAIKWWIANGGSSAAHFLTAYATAAFVTAQQIIDSEHLLEPGTCETVFTATRFRSEIRRSWRLEPNGNVIENFPGNQRKRSQDFSPSFYDAGQFYWTSSIGWELEKASNHSLRKLFELKEYEAFDIDTIEDWRLAELMFPLVRKDLNLSILKGSTPPSK